VGLSLGGRDRERTELSLEELALLAGSAGARVVGTVLQERARRDPATLVGKGKVEDVARRCGEAGADVVVFDDELSPAQQRNVEAAVGRKTLDRTQLILDIFARRARTREGRLQVELAQLDYLLPRLAGKGILLSRLG
jgi:GTP-binding protein HflX